MCWVISNIDNREIEKRDVHCRNDRKYGDLSKFNHEAFSNHCAWIVDMLRAKMLHYPQAVELQFNYY